MALIPPRPPGKNPFAAALRGKGQAVRIDKGKQRAVSEKGADEPVSAPRSPSTASSDDSFVSAAPKPGRGKAASAATVEILTDKWHESTHGSRTTVHVLYTAPGSHDPVELVVSLSKRKQFSKEACAGEGEAARALRDEFAAMLADLMTQCEKHKEIPADWQRIQLTLDSHGALKHVSTLRADGKAEVGVTPEGHVPLAGVSRWFHNFTHGHETVDIRVAERSKKRGPSNKTLDEQAAKRRHDSQQTIDVYQKEAYERIQRENGIDLATGKRSPKLGEPSSSKQRL